MSADKYLRLLKSDGVAVLEGVAGIGKTFAIDKVRRWLLPDVSATTLIAALRRLIDEISGKPSGSELIARLDLTTEDTVTTILVMHPSTSYEEMIGGLRPAPSAGGGTTFTWQPGKLTKAIAAACEDLQPGGECRNHLIVLDEINRCNLPSVLGELIYLIEPSRRVAANQLVPAKSPPEEIATFRDRYCIPLGPDGTHGDLFIPSNLFFLGTMNSSDRSILGFDQALRRRFPPYRLEPMTVDDLLKTLNEKATELKTSVPGDLKDAIRAWGYLNVLLRCVIGPDAMIGHSYWFNALERHKGKPDDAWRFGVLPQAIHAAESARMERFLADIFDGVNKPDIQAKYVDPEQDEIGNARLDEAIHACSAPVTTVEAMVAALRERPTIVTLVGRGHGEKLIVVENTAAGTAATSSTNTSESTALTSQSTNDGNSSSNGDAPPTTPGGGNTASTPADSTSHGTTD